MTTKNPLSPLKIILFVLGFACFMSIPNAFPGALTNLYFRVLPMTYIATVNSLMFVRLLVVGARCAVHYRSWQPLRWCVPWLLVLGVVTPVVAWWIEPIGSHQQLRYTLLLTGIALGVLSAMSANFDKWSVSLRQRATSIGLDRNVAGD